MERRAAGALCAARASVCVMGPAWAVRGPWGSVCPSCHPEHHPGERFAAADGSRGGHNGPMAVISRAELAAFLRSRRDRLRPEDVGLPRGARRRVPGLRREEVAVLAHVGTTWYAWLEQGRDVHPSEEVLAAIADALLLRSEERAHLFRLAGYPARAASPGVGAMDARLRETLDALSPLPAMVADALGYWHSFNAGYRYLIADAHALVGSPADANCTVQSLRNPAWRRALADDPHYWRLHVAKLRTAFAEVPDDPRWPAFLERLREWEEFAQAWDSGEVMREATTRKVFDNPYVGRLELYAVGLAVMEDRRLTLTVFQPADAVTRSRLEHLDELIRSGAIDALATRAPRLRAV